jgi:hypothetical protein
MGDLLVVTEPDLALRAAGALELKGTSSNVRDDEMLLSHKIRALEEADSDLDSAVVATVMLVSLRISFSKLSWADKSDRTRCL